MKALTILAPWAWAIAAGHKKIENRTWRTHYRGELAIHAGGTPVRRALLDSIRTTHRDIDWPDRPVYPRSAIIAVADLVDVVPLAELPEDLAGDPFAVGPWCWILRNVRPLPPIHCIGQLSLWDPGLILAAHPGAPLPPPAWARYTQTPR